MSFSVLKSNFAVLAAHAISSANQSIEISMERLSTGSHINSASDDAAGIAISYRMNSEILGTNQAIRNAPDCRTLIDTAQ